MASVRLEHCPLSKLPFALPAHSYFQPSIWFCVEVVENIRFSISTRAHLTLAPGFWSLKVPLSLLTLFPADRRLVMLLRWFCLIGPLSSWLQPPIVHYISASVSSLYNVSINFPSSVAHPKFAVFSQCVVLQWPFGPWNVSTLFEGCSLLRYVLPSLRSIRI